MEITEWTIAYFPFAGDEENPFNEKRQFTGLKSSSKLFYGKNYVNLSKSLVSMY